MNRWLAVLFSTMFVTGCDVPYEAQREKLEKFVKSNRIGSSSDTWLIKIGSAGPEKIALVFGFMDDFKFCSEIAALYMKQYPRDTYKCEIGN